EATGAILGLFAGGVVAVQERGVGKREGKKEVGRKRRRRGEGQGAEDKQSKNQRKENQERPTHFSRTEALFGCSKPYPQLPG
ncbi:hypothetical protein ACQP3J_30495, partial [Escherichia coli]